MSAGLFPEKMGRKSLVDEFKNYSIVHSQKEWTHGSTERLIVSLCSSLFPHLKKISLRKQLTFRDANISFP